MGSGGSAAATSTGRPEPPNQASSGKTETGRIATGPFPLDALPISAAGRGGRGAEAVALDAAMAGAAGRGVRAMAAYARRMPDMQDVVFAVYHAGGARRPVEYTEIASSCRVPMPEVDVPLAEAVEAGLLEREESAATGRVAFRLTPAGQRYIQDHAAPEDA